MILVPLPAVLRTSSSAPIFFARARILANPNPSPLDRSLAIPEPLSLILSTRFGGFRRRLTLMSVGLTRRISKNILVSLPSLSVAVNLFGFIVGFPDPYSSAKAFMSLPNKALDFLRGLMSFTNVNARKENLTTAPSAPWLSSGFASFSPAGKPTSLTMNPPISTP
jgi:hypothetical protein